MNRVVVYWFVLKRWLYCLFLVYDYGENGFLDVKRNVSEVVKFVVSGGWCLFLVFYFFYLCVLVNWRFVGWYGFWNGVMCCQVVDYVMDDSRVCVGCVVSGGSCGLDEKLVFVV